MTLLKLNFACFSTTENPINLCTRASRRDTVCPQINAPLQLLNMARSFLGPLTAAEERLVLLSPLGEEAVCGPPNKRDPANDPRAANLWGPERQIRSPLLRWLCANREAQQLMDPNGIQIFGARIDGSLELSSIAVAFSISLHNCATGAIRLSSAQLNSLSLQGSWIDSLHGDNATVSGPVFLRDGFHSTGEVRFLEAHIGGNLDCSGGTFSNPSQPNAPHAGRALIADGAVIGGGALLTSGFHSQGEVRFVDARIANNLECTNGTFQNLPRLKLDSTGSALMAERVRVGGSVLLNSLKAEGRVGFIGAQIDGVLDSKNSDFRNPFHRDLSESGVAIIADHAVIRGGLQLLEGVKLNGQARFQNAHIGGSFLCTGATLSAPARAGQRGIGPALELSQAAVENKLSLERSHVQGEVRLLGAQIGGDLDCSGATVLNPFREGAIDSGVALRADGAIVKGSLNLRNGFRAEGEVQLIGAEIGTDLDCARSVFEKPTPDPRAPYCSLQADSITVGGSIFFDNSRIAGQVRLIGAQVSKNLECNGSQFGSAFVAEDLTIKGDLKWMGIQQPENTTIDLTNASASSYGDDEKSWPSPGRLNLDGFVYRNILAGPVDAETRLKWLSLQPKFESQPYTQLSSFLRQSGDNAGARKVLVEMEHLQRRGGLAAEAWSDFLEYTVGYGYSPQRLLYFWIPLYALGWIVFRRANRAREIVPTDESAYNHFVRHGTRPPHYPRFSPWTYTLEKLLPLVKLGQADKWQPDAIKSSRWPRAILPVLVVFGWIFTTLLVAALTGIIHIW